METPITQSADDYTIRQVAQRLERNRATLMEALAKIARNPGDCDSETGFTSGHIARAALASARANFPEQP